MLALGGNVHPQTALPTDGASAIDLEADAVCRNGGWRHVHVCGRVGQVWGAIVLERQEVDDVIVDRLRSHSGRDPLRVEWALDGEGSERGVMCTEL